MLALFSFRSLASARGQVVCFPHQEFPLALFAIRNVVISLVWWQSLYYTPIYFFIKICGERLQNLVVVSVFLLFSLFRCFFFLTFVCNLNCQTDQRSLFKVVCVRLCFSPRQIISQHLCPVGRYFWSLAEKRCSFPSSTSSFFPPFFFFLQGLR